MATAGPTLSASARAPKFFRATGTARLPPASTWSWITAPALPPIGDLNGDGKADLVIANGGGGVGSPSIGILLNKGNGIFPARTDYGVNHLPYSVATGDFNRDGKLDMVVANEGGYTISVLRNYGNGNLQLRDRLQHGLAPHRHRGGRSQRGRQTRYCHCELLYQRDAWQWRWNLWRQSGLHTGSLLFRP